MWYVKRLADLSRDGVELDVVPVTELTDIGVESYYTRVTLKDTETKREVTFNSYADSATFERLLKKYNPYGFIDNDANIGGRYLFTIDTPALMFLDYVKSVDEVVVGHSHPAFSVIHNTFMRTSMTELRPLDEQLSFFLAEGYGEIYSLIELCCDKQQPWYEDCIYLIARKNYQNGTYTTYRVQFDNTTKAKSFIAKSMIYYLDKRR